MERLNLLPCELIESFAAESRLDTKPVQLLISLIGPLAGLDVGQVVALEELLDADAGAACLFLASRVGAELDLGFERFCEPTSLREGDVRCSPKLLVGSLACCLVA